MPSMPRTGVQVTARLVLVPALLWLACGEVPQDGDGSLHRKRFEPNALQDSEEHSFTVDTVPLKAPVVTAPGPLVYTSTPVIRGTAEPGSTVKVWLGDDEAKAELVWVDAEGNWRFIPPAEMEVGYHFVFAIATDAAGNSSTQSNHQFVIQKSHYGWGCTTTSAASASWTVLALAWYLGRRRLKSSQRPSRRGPTAQ